MAKLKEVATAVYNPERNPTAWRTTVATKKTPGIGERVLARMMNKGADEIPIDLKKMDSAGNVSFQVAVDDILTPEEQKELKGQATISRQLGTYFVDTVGELLVRRNLEEFLAFMVKIKAPDLERFSKTQHSTFGILAKGKKLGFIFHVSLLHRIFIDMVGILTDTTEEGGM